MSAIAIAVLAGAAAGATADDPPRTANFAWSELIQPPPSPDPQQSELFARFAEALANDAFGEATVAAKQMVEQVDPNAANGSAERSRTLHNLAVAQQAGGNVEAAIQNYTAAVDGIAQNDNNLSASLILPLRGLALAYLDSGLPEQANGAFDRALHVSNVNFGPHSLSQLPILNARLTAALEQNDVEGALDLMDRIHGLYTRKYPRDSTELLPLYHQQAELFRQLGMYDDEHNAWRHVLIIKRKQFGDHDLSLIEPHMRIAEISIRYLRTSAFRNVSTSAAEKHLKLALEIAEGNPESTWEFRKNCLLSLADFYTLFDMKGRARRYYAAAWELLSSDEAYRPVRAAELEQPVPLAVAPPYPYANFEYNRERGEVDQDEYVEGEMVIGFTISATGRTQDLHFIESNPENFLPMERRVRNSVEAFVYRPRHIDGKAAATGDQQYRVKFYYLPSEYQMALERATRRGPN